MVEKEDGTTFVLDPEQIEVEDPEVMNTRGLRVSRYEVGDPTARGAVEEQGVTPLSAVYDFEYVDLTSGEKVDQKEGDKIKQITIKIKVDLTVFDPTYWTPMISHNPNDPDAAWEASGIVPGTDFFDGTYLYFDIMTLFGDGVMVVTPPAGPVSFPGGEGGGGGCFIGTATFASPLERKISSR